ncbi:GNAT family protein [Nocardia tengchongensis]|uniref:GNAT family N-acetyltransferase n=1 Tax=Nocardia tengchongensis TaxID=2055889 RepID=UPI0033CAACBA
MPMITPPPGGLADDVVALRLWIASDFEQRFAGFRDPCCMAFSWPLVEAFTEDHLRARFIDEEAERVRGEAISFAIVDTSDSNRVWGGASIYDVDWNAGRAAVGYWVAVPARGYGVASRSVRLLARWAFADLAVMRLELTCAPDNRASQRVAERCGFVREGVLRSHMPFQGRRRDTVVFSLLPGELGEVVGQ